MNFPEHVTCAEKVLNKHQPWLCDPNKDQHTLTLSQPTCPPNIPGGGIRNN